MSITSEIVDALKCNSENRDHFLKDAVILTCGHNICKECVVKKNGHEFKCQFNGCGRKHKIKYPDCLTVNSTVPILMQTYSTDLLEIIKKDFEKLMGDLEQINLESSIDDNCEFIEFEIDLKIESLKAQLDLVGDSMRCKLREFKEQMKSMIPNDKVDSAKVFLENMKTLFESSNGDINEYQENIKECRKRINSLTLYLPKLPFKVSDADLDEHIVGELNQIILPNIPNEDMRKEEPLAKTLPDYSTAKFLNMTRSASYNINCGCFARLGYIRSKNEIVICDSDRNCVTVLDRHTFEPVSTINSKNTFRCPVSIFVDHKNRVLVGDYATSKIYLFNEDFEFIRSFGDDIIKKPFFITADPETNDLYVCDKRNDVITIWNGETFEFVDSIKCDSPAHTQIKDNLVYVLSGIYFELAKISRKKFDRKVKGLNAVLVFDKTSRECVRKIERNDWFDLRGLFVDEIGSVYVVCDEINEQGKIISTHSRIVAIDKNNNCLNTYTLDYSNFRDMLVLDNQIILVKGKTVPSVNVLDFRLKF